MVSNLATILQYHQFPNDKLLVSVSCQYSCLQSGVVTLPFVLFKICIVLGGGLPGLGHIWRCGVVPLGYRPSYFVLEGGKEWGGASGSHKLPCSVAPPPARLLRIGGVCALRAVFLTIQLWPVSAKAQPNSALHAQTHSFFF